MPSRPNPRAEAFVEGVRKALVRIDDERAQDQLDVFLLGGTVPPEPIPQPDPECFDCRGTGQVCDCHGIEFAWSRHDHGARKAERCECVKVRR